MDKKIKAVLFDIDGTLLNCNGAGKKSLVDAAKDTFGTCGNMEKVNFQGKTDPLILKESLEEWGINRKTIEIKTPLLKEKYFSYLKKNMGLLDPFLLTGVKETLENLSQQEDIITGLLTGNFKESAMIKLESFSLNEYFRVGAFGDDAPLRNLLPEIARRRIKENFDLDIPFERIFIIGDTVHDIECANFAGAISVSVSTGWTDRDTLLSRKPDHHLDDLGDYEEFKKILF